MIKQLLNIALLVATVTTLNAQNYSGGSGTLSDPYQIANKADLKYLSDNDTEWSKNFIQTVDISFDSLDFASSGSFYYAGKGFSPIGNPTTQFTGSYNGNYHVIQNLYINRYFQTFVGLFGFVSSGATVSNLGCSNLNITGANNTGGLAAENDGIINNCYSSGVVNGDFTAGGLVGENDGTINQSYSNITLNGSQYLGGLVGTNNTNINNCYSTGGVSGNNNIGGLVGSNNGDIGYCYSNCGVTGTGANLGGLIGSEDGNTSMGCFYNTNIYPTDNGIGTIGQDDAQMQAQANFTSAGWDFVGETTNGTNDIWTTGACNGGIASYPTFKWQVFPFGGDGTMANPFIIATKNDLKTLSENYCFWDKHFIQTADISFVDADFETGGDFVNGNIPIGDGDTYFSGSYNGKGHTIDNLYMGIIGNNLRGLFGEVSTTFSIDSLTLSNVNIIGKNHVGSLVARLDQGTINDCAVTGTVIGCNKFGGLVGENSGTLNNCHFNGFVKSNPFYVNCYMGGGIAGLNHGTINDCYSLGGAIKSKMDSATAVDIGVADQYMESLGGGIGENWVFTRNSYSQSFVKGQAWTGGFVAYNEGTIYKCYATGNVTGANFTGGFIGQNYDNSYIDSCYATGNVTGGDGNTQYMGGFIGSNKGYISLCFSNGNVNPDTCYTIGGFAGGNENLGDIENCYTSSQIGGSNTYQIGGFIGFNDSNYNIENCYAVGYIDTTGIPNYGGLTSDVIGVLNCFWDTISTGIALNNVNTGLPTTQMQMQNTFTAAGWDFAGETTNGSNDYWTMGNCANNHGYPVFTWQTLNPVPSVTASSTNVLCNSGSTGSATVSVSNSVVTPTYSWLPSGGSLATASNLTAGSYTCSINAGACAFTQTVSITEPAALDISTNTNNLTITANATGVSYQWIDCGNGNAQIAGETNQSFTATSNGNYAVVITSGACSDTSACVVITSTGIQNITNTGNVRIYPNPTSGMFTVAGFETGTRLEVVNVIGEVVYKSVTTDTKTKIDLSNQNNGVYFIKTSNGLSHKIVKQD